MPHDHGVQPSSGPGLEESKLMFDYMDWKRITPLVSHLNTCRSNSEKDFGVALLIEQYTTHFTNKIEATKWMKKFPIL